MRRIASHYIYWQQWYRMHYLELDADGRLVGVFPLEQEIAHTEFYDGTLMPVPMETNLQSIMDWQKEADSVTLSSLVVVYHLPHISPTSAELSTDNSCSNGHIQRL